METMDPERPIYGRYKQAITQMTDLQLLFAEVEARRKVILLERQLTEWEIPLSYEEVQTWYTQMKQANYHLELITRHRELRDL